MGHPVRYDAARKKGPIDPPRLAVRRRETPRDVWMKASYARAFRNLRGA
jgi:hypothetical protein